MLWLHHRAHALMDADHASPEGDDVHSWLGFHARGLRKDTAARLIQEQYLSSGNKTAKPENPDTRAHALRGLA